jgi:hypothetical protein
MNNQFTGSELRRIQSIQDKSIVFEPISSEEYSFSSRLYTVPLGQLVEPYLLAMTSSFSSSNGEIQIVKEIHTFLSDSEELSEFITEIGTENIVCIKETTSTVAGTTSTPETIEVTEVHIVNNPMDRVVMEYVDFDEKAGYIIDVFLSTSRGLEPVYEDARLDQKGKLISDTYLKYFKLKSDIE